MCIFIFEGIATSFTPSFGLSMAAESSASNVVGKFRSFYSTIEEVKTAFTTYDVNRDGNISREELENGMVQSGESYPKTFGHPLLSMVRAVR